MNIFRPFQKMAGFLPIHWNPFSHLLSPYKILYQVLDEFSDEQKEKISQILQSFSIEERQKLIRKIYKKSVNTHKLHQFILSPDQIHVTSNDTLRLFAHLLTKKILVGLRQILAKEGKNREGSLQTWLSEYRDYFNTKTLKSLDSYDFFTLASLVKEETLKEEANANFLQNLEQSNHFRLYERSTSCSSIEEALEMFNKMQDDSALAYFISLKKISVETLRQTLSDHEILRLAPHLRYGDFRNIEYGLLNKLLVKSSKLNHLLMNHPSIQKLPKMPALQTLNCSQCLALRELPAGMTALRELYCSWCCLTELPVDLYALEILDCSECRALIYLPTGMAALKKLYCTWCSRLAELPVGMVALRELNCSHCSALTELPVDLYALGILDCSWCSRLTELPALMLALQTLNCSHCSALTTLLVDMRALEILDCSWCSRLTELPVVLTALQILHCDYCSALTALPVGMHVLQILHCSGCIALTTLPADMHALQRLLCLWLPDLIALPEVMDTLQELNCSHCTALITLPLALPSMQRLNCIGCISLNERIPSMPVEAEVITEGSGMELTKFIVEIQELVSHPKKILKTLGNKFLLQKKPFPYIRYYKDGIPSKGIDVRGMSRDFISWLIEILFKEVPDSSHLTLENDFPVMDQNPGTAIAYRTLGILLALCYLDVSSFRTGHLFTKKVYECFALFPDDLKNNLSELPEKNLIALHQKHQGLSDNIASFMNGSTDKSLSEEDYVCLSVFLPLIDLEMDEDALMRGLRNHDKVICFALRNAFIQDAKSHAKLQALYHIACGIKKRLGQKGWNEFCQQKPERLQECIEGVLSKKLLLSKIKWNRMGSLSQDQFTEVQAFFNHWVDHVGLKKVRKLLRGFTGSYYLSDRDLNFEVYLRGENHIPVAHTCSRTMEFSIFTTQEEFNQKMELFFIIALAGDGFQIP